MHFHKEGKNIMLGFAIAVFGLIVLTENFISITWLAHSISFILLVFLYLIIQFFRVPHRTINAKEGTVLCPADGKVVVIEEVDEPEFLKTKCIQISVFMSPLNVHVNWFPVNGKVLYEKYHPGKYLVAWHPKSSTENERTTTVVETPTGKQILFRQVAGALAKRIVNYAKVGNSAEQGKEFGFIKFGSRIDLYLPLDANIQVKIGDKVKGQITTIAEL